MRYSTLIGLTVAFAVLLSQQAQAVNPHSEFSSDTDKCRSCHRLHDASTSKLLPLTPMSEFCFSCHAKGQGADTAVFEGVYYDGREGILGPSLRGGNLLGGGFESTGQVNPVTGNHKLEVTKTAYGGAGSYKLDCVSCHTPHGGPNYRLLRRRPGDAPEDLAVPWNGPWADDTQVVRGDGNQAYAEKNFGGTTVMTGYTKNYQSGIGAWCAACHTHYYAVWTPGSPGTAGAYKSGDVFNAGDALGPVSRHRHSIDTTITGRIAINGVEYSLETTLPLEDITGNGRTPDDLLTCLTCHKAHGSSTRMTGAALLAARGSLPAGSDGMNLRDIQRLDGSWEGSRAICGSCHNTAHFVSEPDACATCHRAHTATLGNLLIDVSASGKCETCHSGGAGANTDVMNGKYAARPNLPGYRIWGDSTMNLLGGGFNYIQNATPTTSKHDLGVRSIPYGADPNTGQIASITLECVSCHDPHPDRFKSTQYRLLRLRPNGVLTDRPVTWNGPWTDSTETIHSADPNAYRAYTDLDFNPDRPDTQGYTRNYKSGQDQWCAACHTRYTIREDTTPYDAGDIFGNVKRHRHNTDSMIAGVIDPVNALRYDLTTDLPLNHPSSNPAEDTMQCLTCHRAHGTDAVMSAQAAMDKFDRGTLPLGSTLLRRSQRGVCVDCHANI